MNYIDHYKIGIDPARRTNAPTYAPATVPAFTAEEIYCHKKGFDCAYKLGEYRNCRFDGQDGAAKDWTASVLSAKSGKEYRIVKIKGDPACFTCSCPSQSVYHHLCAYFIWHVGTGSQYPLLQISRALYARAERVKAAELDKTRLLILEDLRNKWTARILTAVESALKFKVEKFAVHETPFEWRDGLAEFKIAPKINLEILGVRFDVRQETAHLFTPAITAVQCDCGVWLESYACPVFGFIARESIAAAETLFRASVGHVCNESESV